MDALSCICLPSTVLDLHFCPLMASLIVSLLFLAFIGSLPLSTADSLDGVECITGRNYTADSKFPSNIVSLIFSLSETAPVKGFANGSFGDVPDRVYGLALCRGDIDSSSCRSCLADASQNMLRSCAGNKGATAIYELCRLRYSDENFFGSSYSTMWYAWNLQNVSDVVVFNRLLGGLLKNLTVRAASSTAMYAAGSVDINNFQTVFAMVQCTRDLSPETCDSCLRYGIGIISSCCKASPGARARSGSCYVRYELYSFFNNTATAEPPMATARPPLPDNTVPAGNPVLESKDRFLFLTYSLLFSSLRGPGGFGGRVGAESERERDSLGTDTSDFPSSFNRFLERQ